MGVNASISNSSCKRFSSVVGIVLAILVPITFGKPKINDVDLVRFLPSTHEEVFGFDIPVKQVSAMQELDTLDEHDE